MKVLIYSSKELYDNSSYEGRAEASLIAYRLENDKYAIMKNRNYTHWLYDWEKETTRSRIRRHIEDLERQIENAEMKNAGVAQR